MSVIDRAVVLGDAEYDINHIVSTVLDINPYSTPLLTMLSHKKDIKATAIQTEYYDAQTDVLDDSITAAYEVTEGEESATATLTVNTIAKYKVGDTVLFVGISADEGIFVGIVTAKSTTDKTISIQAVNGVEVDDVITIPAIAADTVTVIMGSAKDELATVINPVVTNLPEKTSNYCQNFMAMVEMSNFANIHEKEAEWGLDEAQRARFIAFKNKMEHSFLFGAMGKMTDSDTGAATFLCNGITRSMSESLDLTEITDATLAKIFQTAFAEGGSDEKFMFAGTSVINALMELDAFKVNSGNVVNKYGVNFFRVESPYGVLYVRSHSMLKVDGLDGYAIIFDFNNIDTHTFMPYKVNIIDYNKYGISNAKACVLQKVCCPVIRNKKSHLIIKLS